MLKQVQSYFKLHALIMTISRELYCQGWSRTPTSSPKGLLVSAKQDSRA